MATLIGQRLSHYHIVAKLGAGGMGEVYRAHDTRLGRDVAIKALPAAFSSDPERLLRFEREAKVLASLNHPNVAAIYGMEEVEGRRYLALELVEGETLGARIARGPLPVGEVVEIGVQIASGMEAAHERGVVHRDLKPGNVMLGPGGEVKVVDFGLAKGVMAERAPGVPDSPLSLDSPSSPFFSTVTESPVLAQSPVLGAPATLPGVILGTAPYLSPEQARGKVVDRRTDIWSFGCVLYEGLTGRRAFVGETVPDVLAGILSREVEWERLPRGTPSRLRELLVRCLEKDPRKRLRDMGDARLTLEEIREGRGAEEPVPPSPPAHVIAVTALLSAVIVASAIFLWTTVGPGHRAPPGQAGVRRTSIEIPTGMEAPYWGGIDVRRNWVTSPDGRFLVVRARPRAREGEQPTSCRLYRRRVDSFRFEMVEGSEDASNFRCSPDGRWLYFTRPVSEGAADLQLVKTLLEGSAAPVAVANWDTTWLPTSWLPLGSGDVLVGIRGYMKYIRVAGNGAASPAPAWRDLKNRSAFWEVLPGDRGVLLNAVFTEQGHGHIGVDVLDLRTGRIKTLIRDGANAVYSPTGHLVFGRDSTLLAVPFDLKTLEIKGDPVALADGVHAPVFDAEFTLSGDGTLLYVPGGQIRNHRHLVVVDGKGVVSDWTPDRAAYMEPRVSPDGRRVACTISNAKGLDEIWVSERGGSLRRVVARQGKSCNDPVWSPDGSEIAFYQGPEREIYAQSSDGGPPRRIGGGPRDPIEVVLDWSPDGRYLLASTNTEAGGHIVGFAAFPSGDSLSRALPLIVGPGYQTDARISPDGGYVAYASNESGKWDVYVAPLRPDLTVGRPVRVGLGAQPGWSASGRELYFVPRPVRSSNRVMSVSIRRQPELSASAPVLRWDMSRFRGVASGGWDILPDGRLIAVQRGEDEDETEETEIRRLASVTNFFDELKQRIHQAGSR